MKSILISSRRALTLSLVLGALALAPLSAKADGTDPIPIKVPTGAIDASIELTVALSLLNL